MELNYECMRETLMVLEKRLDLNEHFQPISMRTFEIVKIPELSDKFSQKDIAYSLYILGDAGLIDFNPNTSMTSPSGKVRMQIGGTVTSLTYKGHEFLEQIKNESTWKDIKNMLNKIGVFTIDIISKVAISIISNKINSIL